ncbi:MAG: sigma-70 family RNA polymerase sigma factor [Clostridia bacterium]|nr:sigma-70 family RNA polymerase sigma factor [Clostridia bacterium]
MIIKDDLDLITNAKNGNEMDLEDLFTRYKSLATKIARRYFLAGQDSNDLFQEAMIGLFKAYQSYKSNMNCDFKSFANLCINRQIQSAIKSANRLKNKALNEYISLNNQGGYDCKQEENDNDEIIFIIPSPDQLPDDKLISKEEVEWIKKEIINRLSIFEKQVLSLYLKGFSYKQMAEKLNKTEKSIENSLTRIKSKLSFLRK